MHDGRYTRVVDKNAWSRYLDVTAHPDNDKTIAAKVGVSPSTIGRWRSGEIDPKPRQVVALARAYAKSPLAALVAADYLTADDLEDDLTLHYASDLDEISTLQLVDELRKRLDSINEYAGWIASISRETGHPTQMSRGALRYVYPAVPPSRVDGMDFIRPIENHLQQEEVDGETYYGIRHDYNGSVETLPPHMSESIAAIRANGALNVVLGRREDYRTVANESIDETYDVSDSHFDNA